jgi:anti-sigma-K factor RskA
MTDITRPTRPDLSCDDVRELAAAFVLGALDDAEADAVRAHLASCADPHAEMAELGSVVSVFAESVPVVEPPAALKGRILAAAAADLEARGGAAAPSAPSGSVAPVSPTPAPASETPTPFPTAAERQQRAAGRAGMGSWVLRIAAVVAIAVLGGWNLLLQDALRTTQARLDTVGTYEQNVAAVLEGAAQPGSLTAILTGQGADAPAGLASVLSDGTVRIAMRDLPATSGNQVYEAWVIGGDGKPVPLGSFQVGQTGIAYFEGTGLPTQAGIVLALTLEPGPGATAPSSDPVSVGTAVAAG